MIKSHNINYTIVYWTIDVDGQFMATNYFYNNGEIVANVVGLAES